MSFIKYVEPQVDFGESPAVDMFSRSWSKLASSTYMPAAVEEFLKTAKPVPGHRLLLVHGLGSSEYYGANNNGDAFPEMWKGAKNLIEDDVAKGYGFKTFEKNAHTFRDHRNHDPKLTIGGKVVLAAWNDRMHRVELILPVSEKLAPDVVDAIDKGEKLAVSMGARVPFDSCFPAGTPVLTDHGYVNIEDVTTEDMVVSDTGNLRSVKETYRRRYSGALYTLKVSGVADALRMTNNHPVRVVRKSQLHMCHGSVGNGASRRCTPTPTGVCETCGNAVDLRGAYVPAQDIHVGDYVSIPRIKATPGVEGLAPDLARLCGYYLGDGCMSYQGRGRDKQGGKRPMAVKFAGNASEQDHKQRLIQTIVSVTGVTPCVYDCATSWAVVLGSTEWAHKIEELCGSRKNKHLPAAIWSSCVEAKLMLLGGLIDTDGHYDNTKLVARISNTLPEISRGAQLLIASLGGFAAVTRTALVDEEWAVAPWVDSVRLSKTWTHKLAPYSLKCASAPKPERGKQTAIVTNDYLLVRVTQVNVDDVVDLPVFNMAVDIDETYTVGVLGVHNCSICQNKAKHRGQYCKHAMFHMNEVMDDGRKVYVDNPQPNFFDISVLGHRGKGRPADPSAYSIMKVASTLSVRPGFSVKGAEEKKSEIEKKVPAVAEDAEDVLSGSSDKSHSIMDLVRKLLPFDLGTMDGPSSKCIIVIKRMIAGRPEKKEAALATFSSAGFILRPQDLAALGMTGREKLAFDKFSASMFDVIAAEMPAGSLWLPYFGDRVYRNHKLGSAPKADLPADVDYRAYVSTLKTAFTNADTLRTLAGVVEKNYALKSAIANGDLADLQKFAAKGTGLSAENLVAALLAPMLAGAYFRSQQYSGEPVGPVRGFIANHPLATGIAGSLLWHKLKGGKIPLVQ